MGICEELKSGILADVVMVLTIFLLLVQCPCAAADTAHPDGFVLISWDGVSTDTLQTLLEKDAIPNLSSILKSGSFVNISITDHYPDTMAGHAQILTGYSPEITGVFKSMRYSEIPHGYTVFERLEESFGQDNFSTAIIASQERSLESLKGLSFFHAEGYRLLLWPEQ